MVDFEYEVGVVESLLDEDGTRFRGAKFAEKLKYGFLNSVFDFFCGKFVVAQNFKRYVALLLPKCGHEGHGLFESLRLFKIMVLD